MSVSSVNSGHDPFVHQQALLEIESDPSYIGKATEEDLNHILSKQNSHTYVVWIGGEDQLRLSYVSEVNKSQQIIHAVFSKEAENTWCFQNYDLHKAASLKEIIPAIMHCKDNPSICRPLTNRLTDNL